jgi:regulatory protein
MIPDKEEILYQKAAHYCGYQERTEKEIQNKLRAWGVEKKEAERVLQTLKEDHFLDEGRYVEAFIRGKFLGKKWGRRRIFAALTEKGLDQALVQQGIATIENADYLQSLRYVADRKKQTLSGVPSIQARKKLTNYLLQKGYEPDLVIKTVQDIIVQ